MTKGRLETLGRFAVCAVVACVLAAHDTSAQGARDIEGTWQAETTILDCRNGAEMERFSKLVSFNMGGTLGETSSSSLFRSVAFGIWEYRGVDSFRYAQRFFRFNPDGTPAGSVRARWLVSIDPSYDTYAAEAEIQIVAPNGTVVANICGVETATRLIIED